MSARPYYIGVCFPQFTGNPHDLRDGACLSLTSNHASLQKALTEAARLSSETMHKHQVFCLSEIYAKGSPGGNPKRKANGKKNKPAPAVKSRGRK
jgi:hypothetical protein